MNKLRNKKKIFIYIELYMINHYYNNIIIFHIRNKSIFIKIN